VSVTLKKSSEDLRRERLRVPQSVDHVYVACLWPKTGENLGTLARTCDAVGATLVVPEGAKAAAALRRGNTIGIDNTPVQYVSDPMEWLSRPRPGYARVIGVELAYGAIPLADLKPHGEFDHSTLVLGHESRGIPEEAWKYLTEVVEIPMRGVGNSLNVAVAGSLALYKLAGLA
jgi:tRNA (guanosine-2'-O-)-methyltransferase